MAERDAFEVRLRAALLRHVANGPTDFDALGFARAVAAKEPRRHGLAAVLQWRGVAIPRVVWVLLLLAILLAAMVGGMLVVGSQPERKLPTVVPPVLPLGTPLPRASISLGPVPTCPPGSTPGEPGPVGQARPPAGLAVSMAFDRTSGRIVLIGWREQGGTETWTFDVCTNTWTRMHPVTMPDFDLFKMLVYDAGARQTIYVVGDGVWAYDVASDTWTRRGDAPETDVLQVRLVYDPVGGRVVALALGAPGPTWSGRMWSYDAGHGAWQPVAQHEQLSAETGRQLLLSYDQSVDRLVSYSLDGEVRLFDLGTGAWSAPGAESPTFTYGSAMMNPISFGGEIAYDEAARRTVLFSHGVVIAYDASVDRWETLYDGTFPGPYDGEPTTSCGTSPECRQSSHMVYDPVNERLLVYGGPGATSEAAAAGWGFAEAVLAFDTRTREWTVLLEGRAAEPTPSKR